MKQDLCSGYFFLDNNNQRSKDGFMQWEEFNELQQCLVQWHRLFHQYDRDQSGYAESNEIIQCINNTFGKE